MADALFDRLDHDRFHATELATGPWSPEALHGGPATGLLAGALVGAAAELDAPMFPARSSFELQRPVPHGPLRVTTSMRRPGRKVCVVDGAILDDGGRVLVSGTMQGIRFGAVGEVRSTVVAAPPFPPDAQSLSAERLAMGPSFVNGGVEHRFVAGGFDESGPATDWIRLRVPFVADEPVHPIQRVVAAADFGNGISKLYAFDEKLFLNPDLTVVLYRYPDTEWVCLDSRSYFSDAGIGMAESQLFDELGPVGRAVQTLLLEDIRP